MSLPLSIYLHIPFCRSKCTYCAFNTYTKQESLIAPFVDALISELRIVGKWNPYSRVHTIFFGGGTPSLLTPEQLNKIIDTIRQSYSLTPDAEISIEANPNDITFEYLHAVRATGVNRISLGMQSANAHELKLFARRHDNDGMAHAVSAARRAGFKSLNLDLIYGIPHQSLSDWQWSLQQMLALKPDHVSLYALGLEEGTPLKEWVDSGRLPTPDDDLAADMYDLASDLLAAHGYGQYEISNWAKPGYECRHNIQYWRNLPYIGVGPGAHGFAGGVRYASVLTPKKYIDLLTNVTETYEFPYTPATRDAVVVDRTTEIAETLIMGLRLTKEGIQRDTFIQRFDEDFVNLHQDTISKYQASGLLTVDEEAVRITDKGRLLSNLIFRELV
ncbi:MAG: radical SAM family heme chaperone HemW [Anaerolineae bacterium]|nr:radical SAM family heme chaperone HemW [Anaerolineae bacterium]